MTRSKQFRLAGVVILALGLISAAAVYWSGVRSNDQAGQDADVVSPLSPDDSRRYAYTVQTYSGDVGLLLDKLVRLEAELKEPKGVALVIAVVSVSLAMGCFLVASRVAEASSC